MQPAFQPSGRFGAQLPAQTDADDRRPAEGAGVDWAWYAGGWSNADGDVGAPGLHERLGPVGDPTGCSDPYVDRRGVRVLAACPNNLFQYHHQPFNYFAAFSTDAAGRRTARSTSRDEVEFIAAARTRRKDASSSRSAS